jgi:hypothetical protein
MAKQIDRDEVYGSIGRIFAETNKQFKQFLLQVRMIEKFGISQENRFTKLRWKRK